MSDRASDLMAHVAYVGRCRISTNRENPRKPQVPHFLAKPPAAESVKDRDLSGGIERRRIGAWMLGIARARAVIENLTKPDGPSEFANNYVSAHETQTHLLAENTERQDQAKSDQAEAIGAYGTRREC